MQQTPKNEGGIGSEAKVPGPAKNAPKEASPDNVLRGAEEQVSGDITKMLNE